MLERRQPPQLERGQRDTILAGNPGDHDASLTPRPVDERGHGLGWLPAHPTTNSEHLTLYVPSAWPADRVNREGVPSAELFLIGYVDAERARAVEPVRHVLRVRVPPGSAVDVSDLPRPLPSALRRFTPDPAYLLPAGWLHQAQLAGGLPAGADSQADVTAGAGQRAGLEAGAERQAEFDLTAARLVLRCTGADHGTDGLPNDVVRWPPSRRVAKVYVLVPDDVEAVDDLLRLHSRKPPATPGHQLVQVRLNAGDAIDVGASVDRLRQLHSVRSRLGDLDWSGADFVLPRRLFDQVVIASLYDADDNGWRRRPVPGGATLTSLTGHRREVVQKA